MPRNMVNLGYREDSGEEEPLHNSGVKAACTESVVFQGLLSVKSWRCKGGNLLGGRKRSQGREVEAKGCIKGC